jgi:hypothetical protein
MCSAHIVLRRIKIGEPISLKLEMGFSIRGMTTYDYFGHSAINGSGGVDPCARLFLSFLRAAASAEHCKARLSHRDSVRPSVRLSRSSTEPSRDEIDTSGFH